MSRSPVSNESTAVQAQLNLFPVYQPICDSGLNVMGYEALMRGTDSKNVIAKFVNSRPSNYNEIVALDHYCKQLALQGYESELPLFINSHPYSVNLLGNLISPPNSVDLVIELTQHTAIVDEREFLKNVSRLQKHGVQFAIDDFGFGQMPFSFLLKMKPKYIKLAKEVVQACCDADFRSFFNEIVNHLRSIGIQVIAEGIETKEQFNYMYSLADAFQGYGVGMPIIIPEV